MSFDRGLAGVLQASYQMMKLAQGVFSKMHNYSFCDDVRFDPFFLLHASVLDDFARKTSSVNNY
jgi:hypothetical protein